MNSLLSVSIESTIYEIFIILGVVVAASLIVYFIWELVLSLTNKKNHKETKVASNKKVAEQKQDGFEEFHFDGAQQEEPKLLEEGNVVDVENAEEEQAESDEERLNRERREYLEKRRQELIKRIQEENAIQEQEDSVAEEEVPEEDESFDEEETEEEEEIPEEVSEEETEELDEVEGEEEQEEDTEEEPQEEEETVDSLEEEREELLREKEKYEQMVQELEDAKKKLLETVQPATVQTVVVTPIEELRQRLQEAEEKLKANEKDFKQCKKDFIPLNKVWKTHENDEKKLRRKEALVAKQKVVLYGVNNYADIDEEKAKKLAEDLDLLDGLKLSVQHCEEVMAKNAERYPLLKRMYEVLKRQNTELKDEIKALREEIEKREAEENGENED